MKNIIKKALNEIGGYDDPEIGGKHEEFLMKSLLENYLSFRQSMDMLSELLPAIIVQDKLKNELADVANSLVEPMNNYTRLMRDIQEQHRERSTGSDEVD
jgi:argonaute-like protein implicated in RNA metabolism and viral defense